MVNQGAGLVRVDGAKQLRRTLKAAGDDLSDFKTAHAYAAAIAAEASAQLAPAQSGRLRATIRSAGTKSAGIIRAGNNSKVRYAGVIHWGWFRKHIKSNPFLSRGAQSSEGRWIRVYEDYVEIAIQKVEGI